MPARLKFLTASPARLESFAGAPRHFAGRPGENGRVFTGPERCPIAGRDVLQRAVLGAVAALDASLPHARVSAGARRTAHRDLSLRRGRFCPGTFGRRTGSRAVTRRYRRRSRARHLGESVRAIDANNRAPSANRRGYAGSLAPSTSSGSIAGGAVNSVAAC